jgi:hypothetical protein
VRQGIGSAQQERDVVVCGHDNVLVCLATNCGVSGGRTRMDGLGKVSNTQIF